MRRLALEVIATSVADAVAAEAGGADRLELVADLAHGGLTPSLALVDAVVSRVGIPVRVMLRETIAHEVDAPEVRRRILELARELGARPVDGVVFGFLHGRHVDVAFSLEVAFASAPLPATFHRAFEEIEDLTQGLAALARVPAVDRLLTAGGDGPWEVRARRLAEWARLAGPGITMLVGGGVEAGTLPLLAGVPSVREVHVGRAAREQHSAGGAVSPHQVAALIGQLTALARP